MPSCILSLDSDSGRVAAMAWRPDGTCFASSGCGTQIKIWSAPTGILEKDLQSNHACEVSSLAWNVHLASGSLDCTIRIWDATSWECLCTFSGHRLLICGLSWAPGGTHIASGSNDCEVRIWDAHEQTPVAVAIGRPGNSPVRQVAWSGSHLAAASNKGKIRLYEFQHFPPECMPEPVELKDRGSQAHEGSINALAFSPDYQWLISGCATSNCSIKLWNMAAGASAAPIICKSDDYPCEPGVASLTWAPDGKRFASSGGHRTADKWIRVWDASTVNCLEAWEDASEVLCLAWSPVHECCLLSGHRSGRIKMWPLMTDSDMKISNAEDLDKEDVQDKMAVLLSQWMISVTTDHDFPLPALQVAGRRTQARKECLILPDLRAGVASSIAAVVVTFPPLLPTPSHRALYIVFKGTSQIHDWLLNVNIQFNRTVFAEHGVGPHTTFFQEIENRKGFHMCKLKALLERLAQEDATMDFVIAGHSQGGAFATSLFAMLRILEMPTDFVLTPAAQALVDRSRLVTFGAPQLFSRLYELGGDVAAPSAQPISLAFLQAMENGKNFVFGNDPVPRCFAHLGVREFLKALVNEVEAKGGSVLRTLQWIPGLAEKLNAVRQHIGSLASEESKLIGYEEWAKNYKHFCKILHITTVGDATEYNGRWEMFSKSIMSFDDHNIFCYVAAMCILDKNVSVHLHPPGPFTDGIADAASLSSSHAGSTSSIDGDSTDNEAGGVGASTEDGGHQIVTIEAMSEVDASSEYEA